MYRYFIGMREHVACVQYIMYPCLIHTTVQVIIMLPVCQVDRTIVHRNYMYC